MDRIWQDLCVAIDSVRYYKRQLVEFVAQLSDITVICNSSKKGHTHICF